MYRMNLYKPNKYLYEAFKYTVKLNTKNYHMTEESQCELHSTLPITKSLLMKKSHITKEHLCTKYTPFTYKYIVLNKKLPIMKQNLHIIFFVIGRVECIYAFTTLIQFSHTDLARTKFMNMKHCSFKCMMPIILNKYRWVLLKPYSG